MWECSFFLEEGFLKSIIALVSSVTITSCEDRWILEGFTKGVYFVKSIYAILLQNNPHSIMFLLSKFYVHDKNGLVVPRLKLQPLHGIFWWIDSHLGLIYYGEGVCHRYKLLFMPFVENTKKWTTTYSLGKISQFGFGICCLIVG